jgi:hypothetical protein
MHTPTPDGLGIHVPVFAGPHGSYPVQDPQFDEYDANCAVGMVLPADNLLRKRLKRPIISLLFRSGVPFLSDMNCKIVLKSLNFNDWGNDPFLNTERNGLIIN